MGFRRFLGILLFLCLPAVLTAAPPGVIAISGGTVHPVSGPAIPNGTVVIRGGLIEAVGANVAVPPDAVRVDAAGMHVYPGLIDAQTSFGLGDVKGEPGPDALASRSFKAGEDDDAARRATGVTTIVAAPAAGIFNGQSVLLNLGEGTLESRVVRNPVATQVSFNTRPTWTWPDSLMGVIAFIRQTFLDAQQHKAALEVYGRSPAGLRRPDDSPSLDALRPALSRELPVVFVADSESMMRRSLALASEFGVRPILSGARQGYRMADDLRNVPVLVSVKWPVPPADADDREEQPLRVIRDRQLAPTTPAELARRGVEFALVSGPATPSGFVSGIRKAIDQGLAADDALRAVTLSPARIFGAEKQLGSLERGKIANVIVTDKPLFDEGMKVVRMFVDGREQRIAKERPPASASAAPSAVDGTWAVTVRAPQGNVAFQFTLKAEDGKVTGHWSGDRGSGEIRGGTLTEARFELTISAAAQNEAETTDWLFSGTVDGDAMSGTVTTTLGRFEFSGSRSK